MQVLRIPFDHTRCFSARDINQTIQHPSFSPFLKYPASIDHIPSVIQDKKKDKTDRSLLVNVLKEQYRHLFPDASIPTNVIKLEEENTFTITTAHQPSLFTGPLYFIYKIISAISLAKDLNATYPAYHFVPVFVSGGEDHDFEEVNHVHLFGKTITWTNNEKGAVGKMKAATLLPALEEVLELFGSAPMAASLYTLLEKSYRSQSTFGEATLALVHELFGSEGLIVFDMNNRALKNAFIPVMEEELFQQPSERLINDTCEELEAIGYKQQATPRQINLFYLGDQLRERIEWDGENYNTLQSGLKFTPDQMRAELQNYPERFSPNVVIRPLYQEFILPNLVYVGGGGEIAYWLERKKQFEHFNINYPMLVRRHSVLWIDKATGKKLKKLGMTAAQFLKEDIDTLIKDYIEKTAETPLQLTDEKKELAELFSRIEILAGQVDSTLIKTVRAEKANQLKSLGQLESRLVRAEKQKHETAINQIKGVNDKFFPNGSFQERYDNFIPFFLKYGEQWFDILAPHFTPFCKELLVFMEE